ncbi:Cytochrome c2 [Duganella sp. CF458]|uniref:c-type cytochrome n=1 Tax=Duganella sp. CF458 TaxID=1884368 RepID=UPI0008EAA798|nr:c-type cytochrome [Duganella sp. CF458]SFG11328.1 Cytochrome c2 [Duganella sp. CF458]
MRLRKNGYAARAGVAALLLPLALCACQPRKPYPQADVGGDARRGKALLAQFQCGSCHHIPDVEAARGKAGPSLAEFGLRSYIAGRWPNQQANLVRWISAPRSMDPATSMPDMGVSNDDARHMAAYLHSLK